jgi:uncharacterized protein (DUF2249 family)
MEKTKSDVPITPDTKIGVLLKRFPQLENTLIEVFPEFKKLRNPVLRKTIARVTSLRQAAVVAKFPLAELIKKLGDEVGIKEEFQTDEAHVSFPKEAPSWFLPDKIEQSFDTKSMLDKGEQPINKVLDDLKSLANGEIYELIISFLPVPLIETVQKQGFFVWAKEEGKQVVKVYFTPSYL